MDQEQGQGKVVLGGGENWAGEPFDAGPPPLSTTPSGKLVIEGPNAVIFPIIMIGSKASHKYGVVVTGPFGGAQMSLYTKLLGSEYDGVSFGFGFSTHKKVMESSNGHITEASKYFFVGEKGAPKLSLTTKDNIVESLEKQGSVQALEKFYASMPQPSLNGVSSSMKTPFNAYAAYPKVPPTPPIPTQSLDNLTFDDMRTFVSNWMKYGDGNEVRKWWDVICALRGPDTPCERPDQSLTERERNYSGRRKRKYGTVEIIREKAFHGVIGGGARHHDDDHIVLPPKNQWDHFDVHCSRAAGVLGLKVVIVEGTNAK